MRSDFTSNRTSHHQWGLCSKELQLCVYSRLHLLGLIHPDHLFLAVRPTCLYFLCPESVLLFFFSPSTLLLYHLLFCPWFLSQHRAPFGKILCTHLKELYLLISKHLLDCYVMEHFRVHGPQLKFSYHHCKKYLCDSPFISYFICKYNYY